MTTDLEIRTGLDALPATADKSSWTAEQGALMTSLGLKGVKNKKVGNSWQEVPFEAPPSVVQAFLHQARTRRLDPLARQIYCIERGGKWGIEASIDGFRLQAERSSQYLGQTKAEWTDGRRVKVPLREDGKIVRDAAGNVIMVDDYLWVDVWVEDAPPAAARIGILRDGFEEPMWAVATYAGYCPRDRDGNLRPSGQWAINPANQLLKCAEMLGLRKAFPTELSGLYGAEEMDQAGSPREAVKQSEAPAKQAPVVAAPVVQQQNIAPPTPTRDWAAEIEAAETLEATGALYKEAEAAGELGLVVGLAGDKDDGSANTVMDLFWARKHQLSQPAPMVDVPKQAVRRQWVREARSKTTRAEVHELHQEAIAAGALAQVIEEIEAIEKTLPDPSASVPVEPVKEWATAQVPSSEWVENDDGEFVEMSAGEPSGVMDDSIGGGSE